MGAPDPGSHNGTAPAQAGGTRRSAGQVLHEARLSRGLSIQEVARQLRLSVRQVTALEEDDYSKLSSGTFLRGFVRNYAKLLQLDPQPLLRQIEESLPPPQAQTISYQIEGIPFPSGRNQGKRTVLMGALVAVALSLLVYEIYRGNETSVERRQAEVKTEPKTEPNDRADTSPAPSPAPESTSEPASPGESSMAGAGQTGKAGSPSSNTLPNALAKAAEPPPIVERKSMDPVPPVQAPAAQVSAVPPSKPAPKTVDIVPQKPSSGNAPVTGVAPGPEASGEGVDAGDVLRLVFEGESWAEVKDGRGKLLLSRINPPGTQQVLRGKPPFSLTIGNAAQVKLVYNNKPVDLVRYTNVYGGTARLSLE